MSDYTKRWLARAKKMHATTLPHAVEQLHQYGIAHADEDAVDLAKAIPAHIHARAFHERVMHKIREHKDTRNVADAVSARADNAISAERARAQARNFLTGRR